MTPRFTRPPAPSRCHPPAGPRKFDPGNLRLTHPENFPESSPVDADIAGVISTRDLTRQIEATLDRMQKSLNQVRDHIDSYPFPRNEEDDDDWRPRAA